MAILARVEGGIYLDHGKYVADVYEQCEYGGDITSFKYKTEYFDVKEPHIQKRDTTEKKRGRKRKLPMSNEEELAQAYHEHVSPRLKKVLRGIQEKMSFLPKQQSELNNCCSVGPAVRRANCDEKFSKTIGEDVHKNCPNSSDVSAHSSQSAAMLGLQCIMAKRHSIFCEGNTGISPGMLDDQTHKFVANNDTEKFSTSLSHNFIVTDNKACMTGDSIPQCNGEQAKTKAKQIIACENSCRNSNEYLDKRLDTNKKASDSPKQPSMLLFHKGLNSYPSSKPCVASVLDDHYLIPPKCKFLQSDILKLRALVGDAKMNGGYNVIVIDPPWRNKSAKRGRKYCWLTLNQIKSLPLSEIMAEKCAVFVWVTNKQKFHKFVLNELFPEHGIDFEMEWHWVKLTKDGRPVFDFDSVHKRPYETILVGMKGGSKERDIIPPLALFSVPCTVHSHKPPLDEVIKSVLKFGDGEPRCLEMFARSLLPGWTNWGNEVLEMQRIDHFLC